FAEIYDRNADAVFSYFLELGQSRDEAADSANDVFLAAAERLDARERPDDLQPWLLGIAAEGSLDGAALPAELTPAPPALRPRVLDKVERDVAAAFSMRSMDPEWVRLGIFALVTVVIGLIGLAVAAQFEPLDPLPTVPVAESPDQGLATTTTSTTTPGSPSTTTGEDPSGSTTTSEPGAPAALEVSTDTIDFGADATVNQFEIANTGGSSGTWQVEVSSDAIAVSAGEGELAAGETATVDMSLDRESIEEGDLAETVTVSWEGGQVEIEVIGSHEDLPIIHNPQASPASIEVEGEGCSNNRTTISARVRDTSPLESVVVRWSPDGGAQRETAMESVGNDMFEAVIGPFTTAQTAEARIVAFDDRGNAGGASTSVAVVACP
ncbi:MAG TPA: hypothetical protein VFT85_01805, partial [Acidimicrobiia bacterium]|nr:hypothetical protein [Acidimicrobiia bacterium]